MFKSFRAFEFAMLFQVLFVLACIVGEILCIYKAINSNWEPIGKREIVYTVAALTPVGPIVGYMSIEDK